MVRCTTTSEQACAAQAVQACSGNTAPLDAAEFESLMRPLGPFAPSRRVAVAVSGGADSMALALLAKGWGEAQALVVDHGLRPESAAEAALTAARLERLGVPARTLTLSGLRRGAALHVRARAARYAALIEACAAAGMADLLLGHHAADQAETSAMREASGSGPAGLAGMAAILTLGTVRLLRPLLGVAPARLRATLRRAGVEWVEDPGNRDPATRRAQLRAGPPLDAVAAWEHGAGRAAAEAALASVLGRGAAIYPEGFALVEDGALTAPALSALAWTLSGRAYPPSPRTLAQAVAQALAVRRPTSLHGVLLRRWRGAWLIAREPAAVAGSVKAVPGATWDGRYRLLPSASPPPGCSIAALGDDAPRFRGVSPLPSVVLRGLPAIREKNALVAAPHLVYPDTSWCEQVPLAFCPGRSAAGEPFVAATCAESR
jgi:tRNA(Ile)-lysidine synthase